MDCTHIWGLVGFWKGFSSHQAWYHFSRGESPSEKLYPDATQARAESSNGASAPAADGSREYDYDLFTIGAGSGGTRASRVSASLYGEPLLNDSRTLL